MYNVNLKKAHFPAQTDAEICEQVLLKDRAEMLHQANPDQATTLSVVSPQDVAQILYASGTTGFPIVVEEAVAGAGRFAIVRSK